ncbi:unnamed protein product [Rhizoctonia solani]|uniref:Uncharacterized protein n=1 Tax=Rhizoctonia solani TaxID=456999 RepID=A0A8H3CA82_9AGAM|nr:unnamed protein product [Rhizoctonia solani]
MSESSLALAETTPVTTPLTTSDFDSVRDSPAKTALTTSLKSPLAVSLGSDGSSGALSDYMLVFEHPESTLHGNIKSAVSTSGTYLVSIGDTDQVSLLDVKANRHIGRLNFGSNGSRVAAMYWFSDDEILLGTFTGQVFIVKILKDQILFPDSNQVADVSLLMHRTREPIVDLAYESTSNLLAYAHCHVLLVFCVQPHRSWNFKHPIVARIPSYFENEIWEYLSVFIVGDDNKYVLVGADRGFVLWTTQLDKQSITWHGFDTFEMAKFALSPDLKFICGTSIDSSVYIWPMGPEGPLFDQVRTFCVPIGHHFVSGVSARPLVALNGRVMAAGNCGCLYMALSNGEVIDASTMGPYCCTTFQIQCIQSHENMVYLTVQGPDSNYRTMAFTNDRETLDKLEEAYVETHSPIGDGVTCKQTEQQIITPEANRLVQQVKKNPTQLNAQVIGPQPATGSRWKGFWATAGSLLVRIFVWGYFAVTLVALAILIQFYINESLMFSYYYKNKYLSLHFLIL